MKTCKHERNISVNGKCSDMCFVSYYSSIKNVENVESDGYVPDNINIGAGDYIEFDFCPDCGHIQGTFPLSHETIIEALG